MNPTFAPLDLAEEPIRSSSTELSARLARGELTSVALTELYLRRIERLDPALNAYVTVLAEAALTQARASDERRERGDSLGPLDGMPIAVKDLAPLAGVRFTRGSAVLADEVAAVDALPLKRLRDAGVVFLGKTNLCEFAYCGITDNTLQGPTSTPWDIAFNSGGSSGGSASAVAGGLAPVAEASDGGGSIRIPAAMCGLVGYKPSFGLVAGPAPNTFGRVNPFIHVGGVGRTVDDVTMLVDAIVGWDRFDPFSVPTPVMADGPVSRVGFDMHFGDFPVSEAVQRVVREAMNTLAQADHLTVYEERRIDVPSHTVITETWRRQGGVAHASNLQPLIDEHGPGLEASLPPAYVETLEMARRLSAVDFYRDGEIRTQVLMGIESALDDFDVLITPTLGVDGIRNGNVAGSTELPTEIEGVPVDPSIGWCLTHPLNLSGHPAISVPAGFSERGLPVGLQLIAGRWDDRRLLAFAREVTRILDVQRQVF